MDTKPTCFVYFCQSCQEEHFQPIPPGGLPADTELPTSCGSEFPEYPSAVIAVQESRYDDAVKAVRGVRKVFFDGETILVPETEVATIKMLLEEFGGSALYDQAHEYEFTAKAAKAGVAPKLVRLGWFLGDKIGTDVDESVRTALEDPASTLLAWRALASSSRRNY